AYANDVIVDAEGRTLEVRDARMGTRLFHVTTGGPLFGAPSVADDQIFQGSMDGVVYTFGLGRRAMSTEATCLTPSAGRAPIPDPLTPFYYDVAISADSRPTSANFDGGGGSYSARALALSGIVPGRTFTCDGATFRWPRAAPGKPDNVVAQGQIIPFSGQAVGSALAFLGAATGGPSIGVGHIRYHDGRIEPFYLGLSDWTFNGLDDGRPAYRNRIVAVMPYGNRQQKTVPTYVFYAKIPVRHGQSITSITLPRAANQGLLHLFAIAVKR
ncbi:MAG: hypothetical protein M3Y74_16190, partial [Chloroflexota bacterium]|nr:hypothetical protein [Chloroflexota bacterium]